MGFFQSIISFFLSLICLIAGHNTVIDPGIEPTCELPGYSDGSHCERCKKTLVSQEELPVQHNFVNYKCADCGTIDKDHPYEALLAYIYENGEVDGKCVTLEYYSDPETKYALTHWTDTDTLNLSSFYRNSKSGFIIFSITNIEPDNPIMEFQFRYGTDGETIVEGHVNKRTFTTKTPVTVDYYNGPDEYYYEDVEWMRESVVDLLGFLEWYLDSYNVGLTLSDLGYTQFVLE